MGVSKLRDQPPDPAEWQPLPLANQKLTPFVLEEILNGGQSFAWDRTGERVWQGVIRKRLYSVKLDQFGKTFYQSEPSDNLDESFSEISFYFGCSIPWVELTDHLPWRSDPLLQTAIEAFPGLRLLRQPLEETLLAFLCSSLKAIPQIKMLMRSLAARYGTQIGRGDRFELPDWGCLARVGEIGLRDCGLGYRAKYVADTADYLRQHPDFFTRLIALKGLEAREYLMRLPGVGAKIADCVRLFGMGQLDAFPIDTWILRGLESAYGLKGWKPNQLETFALKHFGTNAGLAQQFLFSALRHKVIRR